MSADPPDATGTNDRAYNVVGIVMSKSVEGDAVAEVMGKKPGVTVLNEPAIWTIQAPDRLVIDCAEISDELGEEIDAYGLQVEMSTHFGRMVVTDEAMMLFADPIEAMEYLSN